MIKCLKGITSTDYCSSTITQRSLSYLEVACENFLGRSEHFLPPPHIDILNQIRET